MTGGLADISHKACERGQDMKKGLGEGPVHRAGRTHLVLGGELSLPGAGGRVGESRL